MSTIMSGRVHVVAGGFPPGALGGHDIDYARLRLLQLIEEQGHQATVANDFSDIHRWLPGAQLLITYLAGPYLDDEQNQIVRQWLDEGWHCMAPVAARLNEWGTAKDGGWSRPATTIRSADSSSATHRCASSG
ncbi:MAG: hypothetical protein IIB17_11215 [Chloroflexi bacterium]|nr:hypothetical protein [Chloroflexota bacterium]